MDTTNEAALAQSLVAMLARIATALEKHNELIEKQIEAFDDVCNAINHIGGQF